MRSRASGGSAARSCASACCWRRPASPACIVGARNARQGGLVANLGVSVTSEQAAAVWAIADKLAKDLATIG